MTGTIQPIDRPGLAAPNGHYSHAAVGGGLVFISGQLPAAALDRDAAFEAQVRSALGNLLGILSSFGGQPEDLLRVTAYIVGVELWGVFDEIYAEVLGPVKPARAVVPVSELHFGWQVEIDAVALHREPNQRIDG